MLKWDAADYARNSTAQLGWARELISKLRLTGMEHVLDIGCGDGKITAEIARAVPNGEVLGIDKSREMIDFARECFPGSEFPNLSFTRCDACALDFRSSFDVVFSTATLHWMTNHLPVLRGIRNVLQPGGRALLQMGGRGNAADILSTIEDFAATGRWAHYFGNFSHTYGFYGPEEYAKWLPQVGLKPIRVELIPKDMAQQGKEGLAGWVRTTWMPYIHRVPEELREEFVSDVVDSYVNRFPTDADGIVHVRMVRLEVEAIRQASRSATNGLWILG